MHLPTKAEGAARHRIRVRQTLIVAVGSGSPFSPVAAFTDFKVGLVLLCDHGLAIVPSGEMSFSFLLRVFRGRQVSNP